MTAMSSLSRWMDDRMNPVVVKELRQAVRSRAVMVILILFLAVQLLAIGIYLMAADDVHNNFYAGQVVFMILESALLAVCLLFVPAYLGFRMSGERSDTNVDLVFITTIRPISIVWGKFVSGAVITALIYSACAPFMVLTYLLRGIDLPSIFVVLAVNLVVIALAMQLALLIGALNISRALKGILAVLFVIVLATAYTISLQGAFGLVFFGVGGMLGTREFWIGVLSVLMSAASAGGLLFFICVAVLSPPASNRAMPVRLYTTGAWLVTGVVALGLAVLLNEPGYGAAWLMLTLWLLAVMMVSASGERDVYGSRIRRRVPRRWWARAVIYPFCSGAGAGMIWAGGLTAITVAVSSLVLRPLWGTRLDPEPILIGGAMLVLYGGAYALTAVLIRRYLLRDRVSTPLTPVLAAALAAVLSVVPPLLAFFTNPHQWHRMDAYWAMPNPTAGYLFHDDAMMRANALWFVVIWLVAVVVLNLPWLWAQWRQFKRIESSELSGSTGLRMPPVERAAMTPGESRQPVPQETTSDVD